MTDINDLLSQLQPYRPKMRQDMPLLEWAEQFTESGFIQIPVYVSHKTKENPEGFKWSKVRTSVINGYSNMSPQERELLQSTFKDALYSLVTDMKGLRQVLLFRSEFSKVVRDRGNSVRPLIKVYTRSTADTSIGESVSIESTPEVEVATSSESKKARKGRFTKKDK